MTLQLPKIVDKPWGREVIWAYTDNYVGKEIFIKAGHKLSKQYHVEKEETIYVASGILELKLEEVTKIMTPGSTCHIPPGTVHRFCAGRECVTLIEVSTIHLDDVVRLEDDYGRSYA